MALPVQSLVSNTVDSRLADTSITDSSKIPCESYRRLTEINSRYYGFSLLRILVITDLRTLYSVPTSQFYCFLSRYSGHRAASWNICTHIKSIFFCFLRLSLSFVVDFRVFCLSIKIPSSFSLKALFAVSLS